MPLKVFIDTSAFYALEDADDRHHQEARAIQRRFQHARPLLFTTHHILDEAVTLIGSKLHPARAVRFARYVLSSRIIRVVRTDEDVEQAALNVYERFRRPAAQFYRLPELCRDAWAGHLDRLRVRPTL